MTDLERLVESFPQIRWSDPVRVESRGDWGYACRVCIALKGIEASDVHRLNQDPEKVREHIEKEHA